MWRRLAIGATCLVASGCGSSPHPTTTAGTTARHATTPVFDDCVHAGNGTRIVAVAAAGERIAAAVLGRGETGVVIANEQNDDPCRWLPLARALAARGIRPLLFDYGVGNEVTEALALARWLRHDGARHVALLGGSLGGEVAIVAGASRRARGLLDAVVSLSAPRSDQRFADNLPAARRLRLPVLYVSARDDGVTNFAKDTRQLHRATMSRVNELLLVGGADHASELVTGEHGRQVLAAIGAFLRAHAGAR
jgi:pimeloyl-ACP methyl ester carboxylesterase